MAIRTHGTVDPELVANLEHRLLGLGSLHRVMRALDGLSLSIGDVIPMDEYTIDLVVQVRADAFLVLDTT